MGLIFTLPCYIDRLIASAVVARINPVTLDLCYFEVYATKFYYVTDAHHLRLIIREEIFEHLVDGAFLPDDEPHGATEIYIILFIFVRLALSNGLI